MKTLVAIGYPDEGTAEYVRAAVAEKSDLIHVDEVAVFTRDEDGKYHVHTTHGGAGTIWGGFWEHLFGHHDEQDIDEEFHVHVREHLQPGTSALLIVIEQMTQDEAIATLQGYGGTVIKTSPADQAPTSPHDEPQPPSPSSAPAAS